jgi:sigma-B regulation protein RsbU (phosphoserine phosphatase)
MCFDFLYRPSGEIGGDLYDVLPVGDQQVGLLVSDASGHGVGAALIAAMVRMAFRSPEVDKGSPGRVLEAINNRLVDVSPTSQFATAFYAVYDAGSRRLRYGSGGHPAPVLVRGEGAQALTEGGIVLGSVRDVDFEVHELELEPGDKLLLYTDGALDVRNPSGDRFGPRRLREAAGRHREQRGGEFLGGLVGEIERFMDGARPDDDLTLVLGEPVGDEQRWLARYARR